MFKRINWLIRSKKEIESNVTVAEELVLSENIAS